MALTLHSHSEGSFVSASASGRSSSGYSAPPSLDSGPTISSVQSSLSVLAEHLARAGPIDEDGFFHAQLVECDWKFAGCEEQVLLEDWHGHSKSHFRGKRPPTCIFCPFAACNWSDQAANGEAAWDKRVKHIDTQHDLAVEAQEGWRRPDVSLIQHLWNERLIKPIEEQELRKFGRLSAPMGAYTAYEGPMVDARRRRAPRGSQRGSTVAN